MIYYKLSSIRSKFPFSQITFALLFLTIRSHLTTDQGTEESENRFNMRVCWAETGVGAPFSIWTPPGEGTTAGFLLPPSRHDFLEAPDHF